MSLPPDPPPLQSVESTEALYDRVLTRGRRIRRERRAFLATAAMSFLLLAAAVPVALTNDDSSQVATTERTTRTTRPTPRTSTTDTVWPGFVDETTTSIAPVVEGNTVTTRRTTTARRATQTTRRPAATTSPSAPKPTTTQAPAPTTTTTAVPASPPATPCAGSPSLVVPRTHVAFVRSGDIHIVPFDNSAEPIALTTSGGNRAPAWSPTGDQIAFQSAGGIATIRVAGGTATPLAGGEGGTDPAWSPDGNWIAFVRAGDIYRVPAGGGGPDRVIDVAQPVGSPTYSPNSCDLAFTWSGNVLKARSSDGSGITSVRSGAAEPSWGPDDQLAVSAIAGSRREVHLVRADGGGFTQLTVGGGLDPSWAAARTEIVFEAPTRSNPGIYRQKANGEGLAGVTNLATDADPAW